MRCVTGVVAILPFPVQISPGGVHPRHYPATAETPVPHRLFPDLLNKTEGVLKEPDFAVIVRFDDHPPALIESARVTWGKTEIRNREVRKKPGGWNDY